ncbi:MAG: HEAT repeat domain-containing protein [candidate division Zixibacteria bacterium]|nr:HEAT repeat domain-containing protein [candidate division Zixibacteria bacterium]
MHNMLFRIVATIVLLMVVAGSISAGKVEDKVDSLFVIASSGELRYRDMVQPAIDSLAAMGASAVPRLIEKLSSKSARELHTITTILEKIGKDAVPDLIEALKRDDPEELSRVCQALGQIRDSSAVEGLIRTADHDDWRVRSSVIGALGKIGDSHANAVVESGLSDTVETVRKSAAVATGQLLNREAIPLLVHVLGDAFYGARMTASEALVKFGDDAASAIADSLDSDNELVGDLGCTTLGHIGGDRAAEIVARQLFSLTPIRRALAVEAIGLSNSSQVCGEVEILKQTETDPTVLFYIEQVLNKYASR